MTQVRTNDCPDTNKINQEQLLDGGLTTKALKTTLNE